MKFILPLLSLPKSRSTTLLIACFIAVGLFISLQLAVGPPHQVAAAASERINFQGKIVNKTSGTNLVTGTPSCVVSGAGNDTCDFRVNIYTDSTGGTLLFREPHTNVEVGSYNGVFNLELNSVCNSWSAPAGSCSGSGITWGSDSTLYIEVEFDPSGNGDFSEGETFTRKLLTSVPYAYYADVAGSVGGFSVDNLVKFHPSSAQSSGNTSNALIWLNEDGSGTPNLLEFELAGTDKFVVNNDGNLGLGLNAVSSSNLAIAAATTAESQLRLLSSAGTNVSSPTNGDLWWNGTNLYFFNGTSNVDILAGGTGALFTDSGALTYLTSTTDDFAIGGNSLASAFSVDVSANKVRIGTGNSISVLEMYDELNTAGTITYEDSTWTFFPTETYGGIAIEGFLNVSNDAGFSGRVTQSLTLTDTNYIGFEADYVLTSTSSTTRNLHGEHLKSKFILNPGATNTAGSVKGIQIDNFLDGTGTGTLGSLIGTYLYYGYVNNSSNNITNMYGALLDVSYSGSGSVTNDYGLYISDATTGSANVTNRYGIYINDITAGTIANEYGLYIEGASTYALWVDSGTTRFDGDITWSATTPTITIAGTETITFTDGTDSFTINTSGSVFGFSDGTNAVNFDLDTGPNYTGTARPTKIINLAPEYAGGTLSTFYGAGTDSAITGSMTADIETSGSNDQRTYYQWNSSEASLNSYTVAIRVKLPEDFSAWTTSNALQIEYATESTSTTNNALDAYVYLSSNTTTAVASSTGNASAGAGAWSTITIDDSVLDDASAPEWDGAGEVAIIYLRMQSKSDNYVKVGDIRLSYLAKF